MKLLLGVARREVGRLGSRLGRGARRVKRVARRVRVRASRFGASARGCAAGGCRGRYTYTGTGHGARAAGDVPAPGAHTRCSGTGAVEPVGWYVRAMCAVWLVAVTTRERLVVCVCDYIGGPSEVAHAVVL